jgi:dTDP-4-amino-4,6-dideoxygalactose transaminase
MHDEVTKRKIDYLKNFGFRNEVEVVAPGINSKMDEIRSAYGILALRQVDDAIQARNEVARQYRQALRDVPGVRFFEDMPGVKHNYSYFPIFINAEEYGMTRDQLYFKMKEANVLGRRYFYPLISTFDPYRSLPSSSAENLPVATRMADEVICLPMHHEICREDIDRVIEQIVE